MEHKSPSQTLSRTRDCPGCSTPESRVDIHLIPLSSPTLPHASKHLSSHSTSLKAPCLSQEPSLRSSTSRCPRCHNEVTENFVHEAATLQHPIRATDTTATNWDRQQEENQERYEWGDNPLYHDEAEEELWSAERRQSENTAGSLSSPSPQPSYLVARSPDEDPRARTRGQHSSSSSKDYFSHHSPLRTSILATR